MAKSYLIIGKESCIGDSLLGYFSRKGGDVYFTSRNNPNAIYLDLQNPIEFIQKSCPRVDVAFISAAVTSQKSCNNDPDDAWNINVVKTSELISGLLDRGVFVIFPSTNLVLSCLSPNMNTSSPLQPQGFYATCKAEIESRFNGNPNFASIRIPKVIHPNLPIILQWFKSLEMGKSLTAFSNVIINPISLGYATEAIARFMHQPLPGIWHLSGQSEITYEQLALLFATALGYESTLVIGETARSDSEFVIPKYPKLDSIEFCDTYKFQPEPIKSVINSLTIRFST